MKKVLCVLIVLLAAAAVPVRCFAADEASIAEDMLRAAGAEDADPPANLTLYAIQLLFGAFGDNAGGVLKSCAAVLAAVVASGLIGSFKNVSPALSLACEYVSVLSLSAVTFGVVKSVFDYACTAIQRFAEYQLSMIPVTSALYVFGGSGTAAASSAASGSMFYTVITVISGTVLTPLLGISLVLSLAAALPGSANLQSVCGAVKNTAATFTAFVFSMLAFSLSVQTVIASAADSYAARTVRFASGVFIPVIGSMIGDAARTVISAAGTAKAAVGGIGIAAMMSVLLPPIAVVATYKLGLLFAAVCARVLGCERESKYLYDVNGILSVLLAVVIGTATVFILSMAVFIKTGASI